MTKLLPEPENPWIVGNLFFINEHMDNEVFSAYDVVVMTSDTAPENHIMVQIAIEFAPSGFGARPTGSIAVHKDNLTPYDGHKDLPESDPAPQNTIDDLPPVEEPIIDPYPVPDEPEIIIPPEPEPVLPNVDDESEEQE